MRPNLSFKAKAGLLTITILISVISARPQNKIPEDFGFRHIQITYKGDPVDIIIKSKKGEEQKRKPLFLFCQGSLPIPSIITYKDAASGKVGTYNVFVFNPDSLAKDYHLVIINKPYIPLMAEDRSLNPDLTYTDSTKKFPKKYLERNLLDYYVDRNIAVINFLQRQPWVSNKQLVVAGHSEGSAIAARLAYKYPGVTHLIYSGGNIVGRIVTMIQQQRANETDSMQLGDQMIDNWKNIVADPDNTTANNGDPNKTTYGFSIPPPMDYLEKLKIPVLITYGTKDFCSPFNDYFRVRTIQHKRTNFTFKDYIGVEHNYFPINASGKINYDIFNWDKVAEDWRHWLNNQPVR